MSNQEIESVKELISNGNISEAIDHLSSIKAGVVNQVRIRILKFRLSSLNQENNKGVLSNEEYLRELNKIAGSTLHVLSSKTFELGLTFRRVFLVSSITIALSIMCVFFFVNQKNSLFENKDNFNVMICNFQKLAKVPIENTLLDRINQFSSDEELDEVFDCKINTNYTKTLSSYDDARKIGRTESASFIVFGSVLPQGDSIFINLKYQSLLIDTLKSSTSNSNYTVRYLDDIYKGSITGDIEESILKTIYLMDVNREIDSLPLAAQKIENAIAKEKPQLLGFLYSIKGCLSIRMSSFNQAYNDLIYSLRYDSTNYKVYNNLGVLTLLHRENKDLLIYFFTKAYELSGDMIVLRNLKAAQKYLESISTNKNIIPQTPQTKTSNPQVNIPTPIPTKLPDPSKAPLYFESGKKAMQSGDINFAIEELNEAIFHDPTNGSYYFFRGLAYTRLKKNALANADYNTSLNNGYKNYNSYYALANLNKESNKLDSAIINMEKALELSSAEKKVKTTLELAEMYMRKGKRNEAIQKYSDVINAGYNTDQIYLKRGKAYIDIGNNELALKDLEKATSLNANNPELYLERSTVRLKLGMKKEANEDMLLWEKLVNKRQ